MELIGSQFSHSRLVPVVDGHMLDLRKEHHSY